MKSSLKSLVSSLWSVSLVIGIWSLVIPASAQVPQLINYQGRLLNGTNLVNGNVELSLRLFNVSSGGTSIYEDSNTVTVADGLYSTFIGDNPTNSSFLSALTNAAVWVEVAVNGVALSPRERLASVGYSLATRGILATTNSSFVFNPSENSVDPLAPYATIGGGFQNSIQTNAGQSFIGSGSGNSIQNGSDQSVIGGGTVNRIEGGAYRSFLGGGQLNSIGSADSFLGGGYGNSIQAGAFKSFLGGGNGNTIATGANYSFLGGGSENNNQMNAIRSFVGGGFRNSVSGPYGVVPGGWFNSAGSYSFAAGSRAKATNEGSFVWADSTAADFGTTSSNQFLIRASGGVGIGTTTPGAALHVDSSVQLSERLRLSGAEFYQGVSSTNGPTLLLGVNRDNNRQLWIADSANLAVNSTNVVLRLLVGTSAAEIDAIATDGATPKDLRLGPSITAKANGNVGIGTSSPTGLLHVAGNAYATAWLTTSDRNAKQDIAPVDAAAILEKISALPVATWSFKTEPDVKHIGPMAQDFRAAFGLGPNDTSIATVDADGVALAAIQALAKQNAELRTSNAELKKQFEQLKAQVEALKAK